MTSCKMTSCKMIRFLILCGLGLCACGAISCAAMAAEPGWQYAAVPMPWMAQAGSITDRSIEWPTWSQWRRVLTLRDYNTRVVVIGTMLLGLAAGVIGSFTLLRKRALMGDALSHATLPGIAVAFMVAVQWGWNEKSLGILLSGATLSGLLGVAAIVGIRKLTRLKEDTALGIVLSVFFGAGVALLGIIQQMEGGHAAGLESFIFGKTASMSAGDARLIAVAALVSGVVCLLLVKELTLLCFDENFAGSRGFPVVLLDLTLMAMVVTISIVGLQAVGLILMIALLIIPPSAARFWTERLRNMLLVSGLIGAIGCLLGAGMSAILPRLPSGAMIVLVCALFFVLSMIFGSARGVLIRSLRRRRLNRSVDRQHLLRAIFETVELEGKAAKRTSSGSAQAAVIEQLLPKRSWSLRRLRRSIEAAQRDGLLYQQDNQVLLTRKGHREAARLTREHRLWELFLIEHADIAPSRVDRDADRIEHVLEPEIIAELESLLEQRKVLVPESPHQLDEDTSATTMTLSERPE